MNNTEKFKILGTAPIGRLLVQYAVPAIIAMAASSVYNIIDGIFIGQGVGAAAIMGLALCAPIMSLTAAFGAMVGVGASTLMSVRLGQEDYDTARRILGNTIFMNIAMGLILGGTLLLFLDPILRFFGASDVTLEPARQFMQIILAGNVVTHLYLGLNGLLRSTNRPRIAMYATIGTVLLNCLFCPLFIFVLDLGIRGAAIATVLAQLCMLIWQIHLFSDKAELVHTDLESIVHPNLRICHESLTIGLPNFLVNACNCCIAILFVRTLTHYGGDTAVGSYGIINRINFFIIMAVIGLNQGMMPIAGYNFGARKNDRLLRVLWLTIGAATVVTTLGWFLGTFFSTALVTPFAKDAPALITTAAHGMSIMVMVMPVIGVQIVSTAFFQSIGFPGKSIFLSLSRQLIFLIPALIILPRTLSDPVDGVWYSIPLSDILATITSVVMLFFEVRKFKKLENEGISKLEN